MNKLLNLMTIAVFLSATLTSCDKDEDSNTNEGSEVIQMTMTETFDAGFHLNGSGTATVDWGDGSAKETKQLVAASEQVSVYFYHTYSDHSVKNTYTIKVSGDNITSLKCDQYFLSDLDVSRCTSLQMLMCCCGQLTTLDVSNNAALTYLECGGNPLTNLDVSKNVALIHLECWDNQLTGLNLSKNIALQELFCNYNRLTSLDVSKNVALELMRCDNNQLTELDISKNIANIDWRTDY